MAGLEPVLSNRQEDQYTGDETRPVPAGDFNQGEHATPMAGYFCAAAATISTDAWAPEPMCGR